MLMLILLIYRFAQSNAGVESPVSNALQCSRLGVPGRQNVDRALQPAREVFEPSGDLVQ